MYGGGQLTHTGEGCCSLFVGVFCIVQGRGWIDDGPETVKEEGIKDLKQDIHVSYNEHEVR